MEGPEAWRFSSAHRTLPRQLFSQVSCVEAAFDARTLLANFFSILPERDGGGDGNAWTTDDVVDGGGSA